FFFSSRRRHTRFSRDWSSDVCSSDLVDLAAAWEGEAGRSALTGLAVVTDAASAAVAWIPADHLEDPAVAAALGRAEVRGHDTKRSEERRVGKEGGARGRAHP